MLSRNYVKPFLKGEEGRGEVERRREGGEECRQEREIKK